MHAPPRDREAHAAGPPAERLSPATIAFVTLGGPAASAAAFMLNVFLVRADCTPGRVASRFVLVLLAAAVAVAGTLIAWRAVQAARGEGVAPHDAYTADAGPPGRDRFLAFAGLAASVLSLLLALYLLGVLAALDPCLHA